MVAGQIRFNNSNLFNATQIIISNQDVHSNGISNWVNTFDDSTNPGDLGTLWIYGSDDDQTWDTNEFVIATVNDVTSYFGYKVIDITIKQANYSFSDGDHLFLQFYAIGDQGVQGVQGTQGTQGITGTEGQQAGIPFEFDTSTTNGDPGLGKFRYNNSTSTKPLEFISTIGQRVRILMFNLG